jgi:hypothetical protein
MPYTFYVHHGTSWDNAKKIAQDGFKPSREKGSYLGAGVYAGDKDKATRFAKSESWHGGEGGAALLTMKVTVDDVKTVYGHTNSSTGNKSDAVYYQPGYGGSVKNPEFCIRDASSIEVLGIEKLK